MVFAEVDWQPFVNTLTGLVSTATLAITLWIVNKQRGNDKDTKTAKDAAIATAAASGVPPEVIPEVGPIQKSINGNGMASKLDAIAARQTAHETKDEQRFTEILKEIHNLKAGK